MFYIKKYFNAPLITILLFYSSSAFCSPLILSESNYLNLRIASVSVTNHKKKSCNYHDKEICHTMDMIISRHGTNNTIAQYHDRDNYKFNIVRKKNTEKPTLLAKQVYANGNFYDNKSENFSKEFVDKKINFSQGENPRIALAGLRENLRPAGDPQYIDCTPEKGIIRRHPKCADNNALRSTVEGCETYSLKPECHRSKDEDLVCQNLLSTGKFDSVGYLSSFVFNQLNCTYLLLCLKYHPGFGSEFASDPRNRTTDDEYTRDASNIVSKCMWHDIRHDEVYIKWKERLKR